MGLIVWGASSPTLHTANSNVFLSLLRFALRYHYLDAPNETSKMYPCLCGHYLHLRSQPDRNKCVP